MEERMNPVRISSLHADELLEVFKFLDVAALKACSLVCYDWKYLIASTLSTTAKLKLKIDKSWEVNEKLLRTPLDSIQRRITSVKMFSFIPNQCKLLKRLENIGTNIRCLELSHTLVDGQNLTKILDISNSLEDLIVRYCTITIDGKLTASSLRSLKSLTIDGNADLHFLDIIGNNTHIRDIRISALFSDFHGEKLGDFLKFLSKQESLKNLSSHYSSDRLFEALGDQKLNFKLKKLEVFDFSFARNADSATTGLIKFLKKHRETLEHLEITGDCSNALFEFIMRELRIKRLKINISRLRMNADCF